MTDVMTDALIGEYAAKIDVSMLPSYRRELVYVDYRDGFNPDDVESLLRGEYVDYTDEWISEQQWTSACDLADELFKDEAQEDYDDLESEWQASDERQELIFEIQEHDTSTPYADLLRNTGRMLFRAHPSEDGLVWLDSETLEGEPWGVCEALGLGEEWLPAVTEIQPEIAGYACEGGGLFLAAIVFSANPSFVYDISDEADVNISNPFLWLTNPWSGNGYGVQVSDVTATVKMSDIHTDKAAWGYGADDVFGGLCLDDSDIQEVQ